MSAALAARRRLAPGAVDRIVALREAGHSYAAIAAAMGCSRDLVQYHCHCQGAEPPLPLPPPLPVPREPLAYVRGSGIVRRFTVDEDRRLLALETQGLSCWAIGRVLGRNRAVVRMRLITLANRQAQAEAALAWHAPVGDCHA